MNFTTFKVASVSENTNSFGLHSYIFISLEGKAFRGLGNSTKTEHYTEGSIHRLIEGYEVSSLSNRGFECPAELDNAPWGVINEVWGTKCKTV